MQHSKDGLLHPPLSATLYSQRILGNQAVQFLALSESNDAPVSPLNQPHSSDPITVHGAARQGISGASQSLPYHDEIQNAFGRYPVNDIKAHQNSPARGATSRLNANAYTLGEHVAFSRPPDLRTAAHESAHVIQQRFGVPMPVGRVGDVYERHADAVADAVIQGRSAEPLLDATPASTHGGHAVQFDLPRRARTPLQQAFDGSIPWTADLARQAMDEYQGLASVEQQLWVETHYASGALELLLRAMPAAEITVGGRYNPVIQSILQRVQRLGALGFAATLGMASQAEMAQRQATFMHQRNVAAAQAAAPPGTTPSEADIAAQQARQVAPHSIARQTATLSATDERAHNIQTTAAVATFVTWVQAQHPELNITAANFRVDSRAVFNRGQSVIGFAEQAHHRVVIGRAFALLVEANPAYALSNVMHELRGHNEYGPYGQAGTEFGLELYDQAAALMPGYTQPTGADRTSEIDAFAYQETEIYSQLVEVEFHTPVSAAHQSLEAINADPATVVRRRIGIIRRQWQSDVARALVRGMLLRFRLDPRLHSTAIQVFEQAIRDNFSSTEAAAILQ